MDVLGAHQMTNDEQQILDFIQQQLAWVAEQDLILAKMEGKLRAMRQLAEYRLEQELSAGELQQVNAEFAGLQREIEVLEGQLYKGTVH